MSAAACNYLVKRLSGNIITSTRFYGEAQFWADVDYLVFESGGLPIAIAPSNSAELLWEELKKEMKS